MEILEPSVQLIGQTQMLGDTTEESPMKLLELAIRNCYKSEDKIEPDSWKKIIKIVLDNSHTSTLEHVSFNWRIITSRDVLQEIARHRIASYSVESSRYCCYSKEKKGMKFIKPEWITWDQIEEAKKFMPSVQSSAVLYALEDEISSDIKNVYLWLKDLEKAEFSYNYKIDHGWKPQQARVSLPGCLKTEIIMTMNIRSLLNFFELRTSPKAHPDIQVIAKKMQAIMQEKYPLIFGVKSEK